MKEGTQFYRDFKEWLEQKHLKTSDALQATYFLEQVFKTTPFSMQWGVYVDFFDEKGIELAISRYTDVYQIHVFNQNSTTSLIDGYYKSLDEARKSALQKAIEIYNQNTKTK